MTSTEIFDRPRKLSDETWGMEFEIDCPIPSRRVGERKTSAKAFIVWIESFSGKAVKVVSQSGKVWGATIGLLDGYSTLGDKVTMRVSCGVHPSMPAGFSPTPRDARGRILSKKSKKVNRP